MHSFVEIPVGKECRWVGMAAQVVQIECLFHADQGGIVVSSALQNPPPLPSGSALSGELEISSSKLPCKHATSPPLKVTRVHSFQSRFRVAPLDGIPQDYLKGEMVLQSNVA